MTVAESIEQLRSELGGLRKDFHEHFAENVQAHANIFGQVKSVAEELKRHGDEEEKMRKALFGNGAAGHDERLRNVERFVAAHQRITWLLVSAVCVGALSLAWGAVVYYLRQFQ